ncbi:MAG: segregation/condensation protein A [Oscillospiraceae bacterium]|jgi:segregation and condensation protein A|nr:segregation/condensation protein A [Oscillospiraceae bacterium]
MEALYFKLDSFEGPMDLLLHLVGQRKVSIHEVSILSLIEQYLALLAQARGARLEVAAEFLEMAARLLLIKSAALLPRYEEAEELTEGLRQELLAYRDCQLLAAQLARQACGFDYTARKPTEMEADMHYKREHKPSVLFQAYLAAVGKAKRRLPPPTEAFVGIVAHHIVSVVSRYAFVFERLRARREAALHSLLEESESRSELVATFLAVLALVKAKRVRVLGCGRGAVLELQTDASAWCGIEEQDPYHEQMA